MDTAKLFVNGKSQAVRLPKDYRFEGQEVYIKKIGKSGVLLMPTNDVWEIFKESLDKFPEDFMQEGREPGKDQKREDF